jgi:hypothetical protein
VDVGCVRDMSRVILRLFVSAAAARLPGTRIVRRAATEHGPRCEHIVQRRTRPEPRATAVVAVLNGS